MKNIKIPILILCAALALTGCSGCSTIQKAFNIGSYETGPQAATNLIVAAEKTAQIGNEVFDSFVKSEREHEAAYAQLGPKPHEMAEWLRAKIPDPTQVLPGDPPTRLIPRGVAFLKALRSATETFRLNRTDANGANLQTALATVNDIITKVKKFNSDVVITSP